MPGLVAVRCTAAKARVPDLDFQNDRRGRAATPRNIPAGTLHEICLFALRPKASWSMVDSRWRTADGDARDGGNRARRTMKLESVVLRWREVNRKTILPVILRQCSEFWGDFLELRLILLLVSFVNSKSNHATDYRGVFPKDPKDFLTCRICEVLCNCCKALIKTSVV